MRFQRIADHSQKVVINSRHVNQGGVNTIGIFCVLLLVLLISSCASIKQLSDKETSEIHAGKKVLVLLRIVGQDPYGKTLKPFVGGLDDDSVGMALIDIDRPSLQQVRRIEFLSYMSKESRDKGWVYFLVEPGTHYFAIQPRRVNNAFTYHSRFKEAPRWLMEVPSGISLLYPGTLYLYGLSYEGLFGHQIFYAFCKQRSVVKDEEDLAKMAVSHHFPGLQPFRTILMEPHHP